MTFSTLDWAERSGLELLESYHEGLINTDPEEFLVVLHYHKNLRRESHILG